MAVPVIMPRQGQSVESCIISKWHKKKGDKVKVGDILFTYETDKATFEEEANIEGTILEIFFKEDDDVPVLTNVCVIGTEGESTEKFQTTQNEDSKGSETLKIKTQQAEQQAHQEIERPVSHINGDNNGKIKISPRAKKMAKKTGVNYAGIKGTGPDGRIIEKDIAALRDKGALITSSARDEYEASGSKDAVAGTGLGGRITTSDLSNISAMQEKGQQADADSYKETKISNIRKVIAKTMHHSLSSTAQLTLNTSFDATDILAYRSRIKASMKDMGLENITINDIILYAVSRTILNHSELNAHFIDDKMRVFNNVNLGIAVDTDRGLMVPTLFNSNLKSLNEISRQVKLLASQCQEGTINPDLLQGASFTVTNMGTLGIESFTPVLNPPQVGILGVNTIVYRVKKEKNEYINYPAIGLSLTFDHRALDGSPAARFLRDLKTNLENFSVLMAL